MLYALLCYDHQDVVANWSAQQEAEVMEGLFRVQDGLAAKNQLGPVARLMPTTTAVTLRKGRDTVVVDGPFAETKEQLLGFYILDCATLDEAVAAAKDLAAASGSAGCYEIRPIMLFNPDRRTP